MSAQNSLVNHITRPPIDDAKLYLHQKISVNPKNFLIPKYGGKFSKLFDDKNEEITLSRMQVIKFFQTDCELGMLAAIAWGFPNGRLGGYGDLQNFVNNFDGLKQLIEDIKRDGLDELSFGNLNKFHGVKNGTYTKLLYFAGCSFAESGEQCLIYDSRVKKYLDELKPVEFKQTLEKLIHRKSSQVPSYEVYRYYCIECAKCAVSLQTEAPAIEMFMFSAAPGKRAPSHSVF